MYHVGRIERHFNKRPEIISVFPAGCHNIHNCLMHTRRKINALAFLRKRDTSSTRTHVGPHTCSRLPPPRSRTLYTPYIFSRRSLHWVTTLSPRVTGVPAQLIRSTLRRNEFLFIIVRAERKRSGRGGRDLIKELSD